MSQTRIRAKMCGMTRSEDIAHAAKLGVDAIGLIFYPGSPRYVSFENAQQLLKNLPPLLGVVGVFVNPHRDFVQKIINELPIHLLQFHGDETQEFCTQFNTPFIKTFHPQHSAHIIQFAQDFDQASAFLFDTPSSTSRGGTGLTFDWHIIPRHLNKPYFLSGGLNESNIKAAINTCQPYAVDVSSGIEQSPGIKDHCKMSQFIKALWGNHE